MQARVKESIIVCVKREKRELDIERGSIEKVLVWLRIPLVALARDQFRWSLALSIISRIRRVTTPTRTHTHPHIYVHIYT